MSKNLRPIASLLAAVAFLLASNGMLFTLLPLRGRVDGFATFSLGLIASAYYIGFVSGCLLGPYAVVRAGHIRAFTAMVAVAAAVTLLYALAPQPVAWFVLRWMSGFALAGFYLIIESWLNDQATNENRGTVMSSYVGVNFGAIVLGQFLVTLYPVDRDASFMVAAIFSCLAIVPVALTRSAQPAPITIVRFQPRALYESAPVALVASFVVGISIGAFWGIAPLSAAGAGLSDGEVALFMSVAVAAGAIAQWPVGRMSDRFDRRLILLVLLLASAAVSFGLWAVGATGTMLLLFGFLFGATALPGYALAAAHAYDKTALADLVPTAATILLVNALGSAIGPLVASLVISDDGPRRMYLFIAALQGALAIYVFYRIRIRPPTLHYEKTGFDLATTSSVGAVIIADAANSADPVPATVPAQEPPAPDPAEANGTNDAPAAAAITDGVAAAGQPR